MGDWDVSAFGNDQAKDWLAALMEGVSAAPVFRALVTVAKLPPSDYLQAPDCECAIAAAELVVAARGKPSPALPEEAREWLERTKFVAGTEVVTMALSVVKRIALNSELKELWQDTESGKDWLATIYDLQKRLEDSAGDISASVIVERDKEPEINPDELFREALQLAAKGQHDEAIPLYEQILEVKSDSALAFLGRGTAYLELGENKKAAADFSQSIRIDPDVPETYYLRAEAFFRLAEYERALDDLDLLVRAEPDRPEAFWKRALTLEKTRHYLDAVKDFTRMIELDANVYEAYMHRADCLDKLGKGDLAQQDREMAKKYKTEGGTAAGTRKAATKAAKTEPEEKLKSSTAADRLKAAKGAEKNQDKASQPNEESKKAEPAGSDKKV